jgi:hypothetical protein
VRVSQVVFQALSLVHGGVPLRDHDLKDAYNWTDELSRLEVGGSLDTWRVPLSHGMVTDPTFGVGLALLNTSETETFTLNLHSVRVTAYHDVFIARSARESTTVSSESNTVVWQNPDNIKARDGAFAAAPGLAGDESSEQLTATGFGFALPPTAIVHGVQVTVRRQTLSGSSALRDTTVRLVSGGGPVGGNRALGTAWPFTATDVVYGSSSDLWGRPWTAAEVNDPSFGVALAARYVRTAGNDHARVDSVQMAVSYCVP